MQSLLRELQDRKLDRVAAAYGVTAWLIVQAASIGLPTFGAPGWVMKVVIVAAMAGFPLALWITWHVVPHPHGRHRFQARNATTDIILLTLLGAVVLVSAAQLAALFGILPWVQKSAPGTPAAVSPAQAEQNLLAPPASIAVLPFLNMSGDPAKEYFSDGISEELLNQLANAPALRVAARTSCFAFKGKNEDIRTIAHALNVRAVLEGSVREDGQHIRITAQLINAANGYHLWSHSYDRDLRNILEVQDEIASAITASLTHTLLGKPGGRPAAHRAPIDPGGYRKYLQGQYFAALKTDDGDKKAVELFKQVNKVLPDFAPAYAALGRSYVHMAEFHNRPADLLSEADAALRQALKLDPKNLEALSSHLQLALMHWDWKAAGSDANRLQSLNPHSVFTLRGMNAYYGSLGFPEQQSAALREATRLDPLSFVDLNNLATVYYYLGRFKESASAANDSLALKPNRALAIYTLCSAYAGQRRTSDTRILIGQLLVLHEPDASRGCSLRAAVVGGQLQQAHTLADTIAGGFPTFVFDETDVGTFYLAAGDPAKAGIWFKRAFDHRAQDLFAVSYFPTTPSTLNTMPEWVALKQTPEAKAWQAAHDQIGAKLPG